MGLAGSRKQKRKTYRQRGEELLMLAEASSRETVNKYAGTESEKENKEENGGKDRRERQGTRWESAKEVEERKVTP